MGARSTPEPGSVRIAVYEFFADDRPDKLEHTVACSSRSRAGRVLGGMLINLNHERFYLQAEELRRGEDEELQWVALDEDEGE